MLWYFMFEGGNYALKALVEKHNPNKKGDITR